MLRGNRSYVLTAVGLMALFGLLYAGYEGLDQADKQAYADYKYQPARDHIDPPSDKSPHVTAYPYQPYCDEPKERDDADLCAQWAAVQAVNEGNRLSRLSIRITGLEFGALIVSLIFTGWAALAAAKAAQIAEKAMDGADRPHLLFTESDMNLREPIDGSKYPLTFRFKNHGKGPCWIRAWGLRVRTGSLDELLNAPVAIEVEKCDPWSIVPNGVWHSAEPYGIVLQDGAANAFLEGTHNICAFWELHYTDAEKRPYIHRLALKLTQIGERLLFVPFEHPFWHYT